MQPREKRLAWVFGVVVGLMAVWTMLKPWYFGPIDEQQLQLGLVQTNLDQLEDQQMQLLNATRQLADWKSRSLPPDPKATGRQSAAALNGQRLYQEWLIDLARHCGFREPEVTPDLRKAIRDTYVSVQVRLTAQATYAELTQFLALFEQTDLLHRIESCRVESTTHRGDPVLEVTLVAEGLALQTAPQRRQLFPETELLAAIEADSAKLVVKDGTGFPESGRFGIRLGGEQLTVSQVKGNEWTVSRAKDGTKAVAQAAGVKLDLGLYNPLVPGSASRETHPRLAAISQENPFRIPGIYDPRLVVPEAQTVTLGDLLQFSVQASGLDLSLGQPLFQLGSGAPKGMTIDSPTGTVRWQPADAQSLGEYTVPIALLQREGKPPLVTESVKVRVQDRNFTPEIRPIDPQVAYSGQTLKFSVMATDRNQPKQTLTYALGQNAPAEAALDPKTGVFTWTAPGPAFEQSLELEIIVTDNGNPPERATLKVPLAVKADVAQFVRYVGLLSDSNDREAWFFDRWNNEDLVLKEGELLKVADLSARLEEIGREALIFRRGEETWRLEIGQDVRAMQRWEPKPAE